MNVVVSNMTSMVAIYAKLDSDGVQYGIKYIFGDNYTDKDVVALNKMCDTITYREHYFACIGKYPEDNTIVSYNIPGREKSVLFYNTPLHNVKKAGEKIAKILKVPTIKYYLGL